MAIYKREDGKEQPHWKLGIFKIRIPFVHHRFEWIEFFQGLVLFAIGMSVVPIMEEYLGFSYEAALASVILFQFLMMLPTLIGVPFVPGMLTPMLPLVIIFLADFEPGPEAIQALVAVQITTALIFLIMGLTGLGNVVTKILPASIKGGIILGAGIAALMGELQQGGRVLSTPYTLMIGGIVCLFIMYSHIFKKFMGRSKVLKMIANMGIMPAILVAIIIGVVSQEYSTPNIEWGFVVPAIGELWQYTPFVVGFPSLEIWLLAIPTALVAYIIGYGDIVIGSELVNRASKNRNDEKIENNVSLLHYTVFIRNGLLGLISPHPGMGGPIFTAGMATVAERYKNGKKAMESIYSGATSFTIGVFLPLLLLPLVTFFQPYMPIALSITLLLTGYLCIVVGIQQVNSDIEKGIAGVTAVVLVQYGAAIALAVGIMLFLIIQFKGFTGKKKEDEQAEVAAAKETGI